MFCPKCGTEISNDALFCYNCGNPISVDQTNAVNTVSNTENPYDFKPINKVAVPVKNDNKPIIIIGALIFAALVVLIVVIVWVFGLKKKETAEQTKEVESSEMDADSTEEKSKYRTIHAGDFTFEFPNDEEIYINENASKLGIKNVYGYTKGEIFSEEGNYFSGEVSYDKDLRDGYTYDLESIKRANDRVGFDFDTINRNGLTIYYIREEIPHDYPGEKVKRQVEEVYFIPNGNEYLTIKLHFLERSISEDDEYAYHEFANNLIDSIHCIGATNSLNSEYENESIGSDNVSAQNTSVREFLDSYEAFMNKYIAFMEKYQNSNDVVSMMDDYADIMKQYYDYAEKVEKLDTSNMTKEDYEYYIDVTTRVNKKLLKIATN